MITQETRERMENIIKCIRAKLEGKKVQYQLPNGPWETMCDELWDFSIHWNYRIAPEPQEKLKRWIVNWKDRDGNPHSSVFDSLMEAEEYRNADPSGGTIIELTETARIEPKKREPRRIWHNRYGGQWGMVAFTSAERAREEADTGQSSATEIAVEFMEVVK